MGRHNTVATSAASDNNLEDPAATEYTASAWQSDYDTWAADSFTYTAYTPTSLHIAPQSTYIPTPTYAPPISAPTTPTPPNPISKSPKAKPTTATLETPVPPTSVQALIQTNYYGTAIGFNASLPQNTANLILPTSSSSSPYESTPPANQGPNIATIAIPISLSALILLTALVYCWRSKRKISPASTGGVGGVGGGSDPEKGVVVLERKVEGTIGNGGFVVLPSLGYTNLPPRIDRECSREDRDRCPSYDSRSERARSHRETWNTLPPLSRAYMSKEREQRLSRCSRVSRSKGLDRKGSVYSDDSRSDQTWGHSGESSTRCQTPSLDGYDYRGPGRQLSSIRDRGSERRSNHSEKRYLSRDDSSIGPRYSEDYYSTSRKSRSGLGGIALDDCRRGCDCSRHSRRSDRHISRHRTRDSQDRNHLSEHSGKDKYSDRRASREVLPSSRSSRDRYDPPSREKRYSRSDHPEPLVRSGTNSTMITDLSDSSWNRYNSRSMGFDKQIPPRPQPRQPSYLSHSEIGLDRSDSLRSGTTASDLGVGAYRDEHRGINDLYESLHRAIRTPG